MRLLFFVLAILASQSAKCEISYDYTEEFYECMEIERDTKQKTLAQVENDCAKKLYDAKLAELNTAYLEFSKDKRKALKASHDRYLAFVKRHGKEWGTPFGARAYSFNSYGSMIDLLNIRINHYKILADEGG